MKNNGQVDNNAGRWNLKSFVRLFGGRGSIFPLRIPTRNSHGVGTLYEQYLKPRRKDVPNSFCLNEISFSKLDQTYAFCVVKEILRCQNPFRVANFAGKSQTKASSIPRSYSKKFKNRVFLTLFNFHFQYAAAAVEAIICLFTKIS